MWNELRLEKNFIDEEDIIAKLQLVAQLEKSDPYPVSGNDAIPLFDRMERSLRCVDPRHQQYVLALFANVIYLPRKFSHAVLLYLFQQTIEKRQCTKEEFVRNALFLEVDPTGIVNDFLRSNEIHGRLDKKTFQREQQIKPFTYLAERALNGKLYKDEENVIPWLDKKYWVVLSDNALSGTSLESDLARLVDLSIKENKNPEFIILIRDLTSKAKEKIVNRFKDLFENKRMFIEMGVYLDDRYIIAKGNDNCRLFNNKETFAGVMAACDWLADLPEYKNDQKLEDHKLQSQKECEGDDLRYGFKRCGLTLVTSENCPSNSLPLLWYKNENIYLPPFPRVLSRIGGVQNDSK